MKIKVYHFTIDQETICLTTLIPPNQRGYCFECGLEKEIWVISERQIGILTYAEERKFCWTCALTNLTKLEQNDCKFENKKEMIKEIRASLLANPSPNQEGQELLELYG